MSTILVVDDDDQVRSLLRRILQKEATRSTRPQTARQPSTPARSKCPDLLILDLVMPGKEGLETSRRSASSTRRTRILAISGGGAGRSQSY